MSGGEGGWRTLTTLNEGVAPFTIGSYEGLLLSHGYDLCVYIHIKHNNTTASRLIKQRWLKANRLISQYNVCYVLHIIII